LLTRKVEVPTPYNVVYTSVDSTDNTARTEITGVITTSVDSTDNTARTEITGVIITSVEIEQDEVALAVDENNNV